MAQKGKPNSGLFNPVFGDKGVSVRVGDASLVGNIHLATFHNA